MKSPGRAAPSLRGRALRHLSQREHSRAELRRKLLRHALADAARPPAHEGAPDATDAPDAESLPAEAAERVERLLDELAAAGWLSDTRAAESLVATKAARFGAVRLSRMLAERGIDREAAAAAMEQARTTELQRAAEVWRKRYGEQATNAADRARQQRFLLARGFSAAIVRQVTGGDFGQDGAAAED